MIISGKKIKKKFIAEIFKKLSHWPQMGSLKYFADGLGLFLSFTQVPIRGKKHEVSALSNWHRVFVGVQG